MVVRAGLAILVSGLTACLNEGLPQSPTPQLTDVSVAGVVIDAAQNPIDAAAMQLTTQAGTFYSTTSDAQGRYALSGNTVVSGTITMRALKAGFVTGSQTRQVPATGGVIQMDFTLDPAPPPSPPAPPIFDLTGEHTLTIVADAACDALPEAARSRTYLALARSTSVNVNYFEIPLSGATFFPSHDAVAANVSGAGVIYVASALDEYSVVEVLNDGAHVESYGLATPVGGWSNVVAATFNGTISYCPAGGASTYQGGAFRCNTAIRCHSASHQLRLTRR